MLLSTDLMSQGQTASTSQLTADEVTTVGNTSNVVLHQGTAPAMGAVALPAAAGQPLPNFGQPTVTTYAFGQSNPSLSAAVTAGHSPTAVGIPVGATAQGTHVPVPPPVQLPVPAVAHGTPTGMGIPVSPTAQAIHVPVPPPVQLPVPAVPVGTPTGVVPATVSNTSLTAHPNVFTVEYIPNDLVE